MENWWILIIVGVCCGTIGSSLGIGGGAIMVPILVLFFSFSQKSAQGISLFVMIPMAALAAYRYYKDPNIDIDLWTTFFMAIGAVIGAYIGSTLASRLPASVLRKCFAVLLIIVAAKMLLISGADSSVATDGSLTPAASADKD